MDEGLLFVGRTENEQFLELVENQIHRPQMIEIQGLNCLRNGGLVIDGSLRMSPDLAVKRRIDIVFSADEQLEPIGRLETVGQAALNQAGLAGARLAVNQHEVGLEDKLVKLLDLFLPAKENFFVL